MVLNKISTGIMEKTRGSLSFPLDVLQSAVREKLATCEKAVACMVASPSADFFSDVMTFFSSVKVLLQLVGDVSISNKVNYKRLQCQCLEHIFFFLLQPSSPH